MVPRSAAAGAYGCDGDVLLLGERPSEPAYNVASGCSLRLEREHELLLVLVPLLDQPIGWGAASRSASASGDEP